jgi:hypothetical protein
MSSISLALLIFGMCYLGAGARGLSWWQRYDHRRERECGDRGYCPQSRISHFILAVLQVWVSRDVGVYTLERVVSLVPLSPLTLLLETPQRWQ